MKKSIRFLCIILIICSLPFLAGPSCGGGTGVKPSPPQGDTTAPTVSSVSPGNEATGVATNTKVYATFPEDMDGSTINSTTFTVSGVSGTVTYDPASKTATFTPPSNLAGNTTYTATVKASVKDLAGNQMGLDYVWTFTTGSNPDTDPPTVISTDPGDGATDVGIGNTVAATFSEAINPATLTPETFLVNGPSGNVPGTVAYDQDTKTVTFTPSQGLIYGTTYTATFKGSVEDSVGNPMGSDFVWSFTTPASASPISKVYVANNGNNFISQINPDNSISNIVLASADGSPVNMTIDPTRGRAFVIREGGLKIQAIDIATDTHTYSRWVDPLAQWGVVDPNTGYVYVSISELSGSRYIMVIPGGSGSAIATIPNITDSSRFCGYMLLNPSASELYCLNRSTGVNPDDTITFTNTIDNSIKVTVNVGRGPFGAVVVGNYLYVACAWSDGIYEINLTTYNVDRIIPMAGATCICGIITNPDETEFYVADTCGNAILRINIATGIVLTTIPVGIEPLYLVRNGDKIYVTNYGDSSVSKIDIPTGDVLATIPVGDKPVGLDIYIP